MRNDMLNKDLIKIANNRSPTKKGEALTDKKQNQQERPWRNKKTKSSDICEVYERIAEIVGEPEFHPDESWKDQTDCYFQKRAWRMYCCGRHLEFAEHKVDEDAKKILLSADFCGQRLCPMCQWRRTLRNARRIKAVLETAEVYYPRHCLIFLTLTVPNCCGVDLSRTIDMLLKAFKLMSKYKDFKDFVIGWYRALEVTHNSATGTFHPHLHAILLVKPAYFSGGKPAYDSEKWRSMWHRALERQPEYMPFTASDGSQGREFISIEAVKKRQTGRAIAEISKYATKDSDIIKATAVGTDEAAEVLFTYDTALSNRRLIALGGVFKTINAELFGKKSLDDDDDLIGKGDGDNDDVNQYYVTGYNWVVGRHGVGDYYCDGTYKEFKEWLADRQNDNRRTKK